MQFLHPENNFFCGSIVGSNLAIAPGVAMAMKESGSDNVCVCLFGDGASNTGGFHEGINLAAIWKLPVVFVCENNQYAEAMPAREFLSCERVSQRAAGYGLKEITVDGNDVEATWAASADAVAQCRAGQGPVLVEALTYRIRGHYVGDPEDTYRAARRSGAMESPMPNKMLRRRSCETWASIMRTWKTSIVVSTRNLNPIASGLSNNPCLAWSKPSITCSCRGNKGRGSRPYHPAARSPRTRIVC